jgi:hypothetical protein
MKAASKFTYISEIPEEAEEVDESELAQDFRTGAAAREEAKIIPKKRPAVRGVAVRRGRGARGGGRTATVRTDRAAPAAPARLPKLPVGVVQRH